MEQILRDQGWEPETNLCRCGHKGGDHSSWGNRCLICEDDTFASFSEKELWANAIAALEAAGVTRATPAPLDERPPALPPANPSLMSSLDDEVVLWNPEPLEHFPMSSPHDTSDRRCSCGELLTCPAATPDPLDGHQTPGEFHDYRVACVKCGEPGFLHVSWRPETWTDPGSLTAALNAQEADHD